MLMSTFVLDASAGEVRRGIEYGQAGETRLLMDVHVPDGKGPFAAVVIVHGGGWIAGDRRLNVEPLFAPLAEAGMVWFSISYRMATDGGIFGAAIGDVEQAVLFVRNHAPEYGVDPERIALVGESAGAQLASMAALAPSLKGMVKGVVALYSPSDLVTLARTSDHVPPELRRAIENSAWAGFVVAGLRRLSPIHNVRADMPPFLLIHGTADRLVPFDQSRRMFDKMREAGASCELFAVAGGGHGMRWWDDGNGRAGYKAAMISWLEKRFAGIGDVRGPVPRAGQ